jgi:hypothetical protein
MKIMKLTLILGVFIMLSSCINNSIEYYKNTTPKMDIKEYFNGPIKAWGIVQDWRGRVVNRFDVTMVGQWEGDTGTLTEHFTYYDGKKQERVWTIKKMPNGSYEGTASDIIDKATGNTSGSSARWSYMMNLPVNDTTYLIKFDDWMWIMNDGVLINRSYLKKFGITVSELTIFMQKQKP